jgi:hypothetical protein
VPATTYPKVLTVAQQAKANDARAEAEAARPSEDYFYAAPRRARHPFPRLPLSVLAASLGGAAAA